MSKSKTSHAAASPLKKPSKVTFQKAVLIAITVIVLLTFLTPTIFSLMQ